MIRLQATKLAENSASNAYSFTPSAVGRTMTITPRKPTMVAPHRLMSTTSLRMMMASNVANMAREKLIAVASAKGRWTIAVNPVVMATMETAHRERCNFNRLVLKAPGNSLERTGLSSTKTNICLKNRISSTGRR